MFTRLALRFGSAFPRLRSPAAIFAIWSIVAVVAAIQAAALVRLHGRADLVPAIANRVSIIPLWALATPLILRSAQWFPVALADRRPDPLSLVTHLGLGSLFVVATNALIRMPMIFGAGSDGGFDAFSQSTLRGVAEYYPPAMVVYGVIVAVGHAMWGRNAGTAVASGAAPPNAYPRAELMPESRLASPPAIDETIDSNIEALPTRGDGHLTVRQWNRVHLVRIEDIDWVEAHDNYVIVHAASRSYKGRERISDVAVQLDPHRFVRIHRSTIVQIGRIREVQPLTHGDHAVILRDGTVLRVARSRRQALGEALGLEL